MLEASEILNKDYKIDSDVWSVTSYNELRKDGLEIERYNLLNPNEKPKETYVEKCLKNSEGPILAASDYMRISSDQIRPYTNKSFYSLGTDGYGRSDTRKNLRNFFEVDKKYIVTYALSVLSKEQLIASKYAEEAIKKYNIDVLTISIDKKNIKDQLEFLSKNGASNLDHLFDKEMKIFRALKLRGIPTTIIVDQNSFVISKHEGVLKWGEDVIINKIKNLFY